MEICVPAAVFQEVARTDKPFAKELGLFLNGKSKRAKNEMAVKLLSSDLGAGEAEAIVLALELQQAIVLIDDLKARRFAKMNGLKIIGTMGMLHPTQPSYPTVSGGNFCLRIMPAGLRRRKSINGLAH